MAWLASTRPAPCAIDAAEWMDRNSSSACTVAAADKSVAAIKRDFFMGQVFQ
jgi:hypothetical protein